MEEFQTIFRDPWREGQAPPKSIFHGQAFEAERNWCGMKNLAAGTQLITSFWRRKVGGGRVYPTTRFNFTYR
jgi:hypothetical protein